MMALFFVSLALIIYSTSAGIAPWIQLGLLAVSAVFSSYLADRVVGKGSIAAINHSPPSP